MVFVQGMVPLQRLSRTLSSTTDSEYRAKLARLELQEIVTEIGELFAALKASGKLDPTFPARLERIKKALANE